MTDFKALPRPPGAQENWRSLCGGENTQELYWKFIFCDIDTSSHRLWALANRKGTRILLQIEGCFTSVVLL